MLNHNCPTVCQFLTFHTFKDNQIFNSILERSVGWDNSINSIICNQWEILLCVYCGNTIKVHSLFMIWFVFDVLRMHYSIDNNILDYLLRCKTTYTQLYKKCSWQGWHKSSNIILFPILRYTFLENTFCGIEGNQWETN